MNQQNAGPNFGHQQINMLKGVFIFLIVVGHNPIISSSVSGLHSSLYNFHVQAFFILPFLFPTKCLSLRWLLDRAVRYLVPYITWVSIAAILYCVVGLYVGDDLSWGVKLIKGVAIGSAPALKAACGLQLYWFLPALMVLTVLRSALSQASKGFYLGWVIFTFLVLMLIGRVDAVLVYWQVWSCLTVVALWPICLLAVKLHQIMLSKSAWISLMFGASGLAIALSFIGTSEYSVNVAALKFITILEPLAFIGQVMAPVASFIVVVGLTRVFRKSWVLEMLGKNSLLIYLSHTLFFYFFVAVHHVLLGEIEMSLRLGVCFLLLTLGASLLLAFIITRVEPLRRFFMPRSWNDLKGEKK